MGSPDKQKSFEALFDIRSIFHQRPELVPDFLSRASGLNPEIAYGLAKDPKSNDSVLHAILRDPASFDGLDPARFINLLFEAGRSHIAGEHLALLPEGQRMEAALRIIRESKAVHGLFESLAGDTLGLDMLDLLSEAARSKIPSTRSAAAKFWHTVPPEARVDLATTLIEHGKAFDVVYRIKDLPESAWNGLMLKMVESGQGDDIITYAHQFGVVPADVVEALLAKGYGNDMFGGSHDRKRFAIPERYGELMRRWHLRGGDIPALEIAMGEHPALANIESPDESDFQAMFKALFSSDAEEWGLETVRKHFSVGARIFGAERMFRFTERERCSREDMLACMEGITSLLDANPGISPEGFFSNVLEPVSVDTMEYGGEGPVSSYQLLDNILRRLLSRDIGSDIALIAECQRRLPDYMGASLRTIAGPSDIFSTWENMKIYYDLSRMAEEETQDPSIPIEHLALLPGPVHESGPRDQEGTFRMSSEGEILFSLADKLAVAEGRFEVVYVKRYGGVLIPEGTRTPFSIFSSATREAMEKAAEERADEMQKDIAGNPDLLFDSPMLDQVVGNLPPGVSEDDLGNPRVILDKVRAFSREEKTSLLQRMDTRAVRFIIKCVANAEAWGRMMVAIPGDAFRDESFAAVCEELGRVRLTRAAFDSLRLMEEIINKHDAPHAPESKQRLQDSRGRAAEAGPSRPRGPFDLSVDQWAIASSANEHCVINLGQAMESLQKGDKVILRSPSKETMVLIVASAHDPEFSLGGISLIRPEAVEFDAAYDRLRLEDYVSDIQREVFPLDGLRPATAEIIRRKALAGGKSFSTLQERFQQKVSRLESMTPDELVAHFAENERFPRQFKRGRTRFILERMREVSGRNLHEYFFAYVARHEAQQLNGREEGSDGNVTPDAVINSKGEVTPVNSLALARGTIEQVYDQRLRMMKNVFRSALEEIGFS